MIDYIDKKNNAKNIFFKINNFLNFLKIILIISIINYNFLYSYKYNLKKNEFNYNNKNEMGNYNLYNLTSLPLISILINIEEFIFNEKNLINLIMNLRNQTIKNIQIIFYISKFTNTKLINIIKNIILKDERIEIYYSENINKFKNIYDLFNQINGMYTIIIKEYITLKKDDLNNYYNFTKGKINNIFNCTTNNNHLIYLIRSKILRDISDNNYYFNNFNELINYILLMPNPQINYISISYCPNNNYVPLAYVSMISILNSKEPYTYISFYIIIPKDFTQRNIDFLYSLYEQYDYFNITFLKMNDRYNKAYISRYITIHAYYRFSLGELLPNLNKIIYLDTDTICYKDLTRLYNLNFRGKMILGQVIVTNKNKKTGYYSINSGILLLNLKEMRRLKIEEKVLNIINKGYKHKFHDQAIINFYFKKYVGIFPPQYHGRPYLNYLEIVEYNQKSGNIYDNDYLYFAWKYPAIRHFVGYSKPNYHNKYNKEDWWYFARKSKYFKKKSYILSKIFNFI